MKTENYDRSFVWWKKNLHEVKGKVQKHVFHLIIKKINFDSKFFKLFVNAWLKILIEVVCC